MINHRKRILKEDLEYGWSLVFEMFKMSAFWIDNNLPKNHKSKETIEENSPHSIVHKAYRRNIKDKKKYPKVPKQYISRNHMLASLKSNYKRSRAWFSEQMPLLIKNNKASQMKVGNKIYYKVDPLKVTVAKNGDEVDLMLQLDLASEFHD
jgi:hypothetical protein